MTKTEIDQIRQFCRGESSLPNGHPIFAPGWINATIGDAPTGRITPVHKRTVSAEQAAAALSRLSMTSTGSSRPVEEIAAGYAFKYMDRAQRAQLSKFCESYGKKQLPAGHPFLNSLWIDEFLSANLITLDDTKLCTPPVKSKENIMKKNDELQPETIMSAGIFKCELHMPAALKSRFDSGGSEIAQSLPPYAPQLVYQVDDFNEVPESWHWAGPTDTDYFVVVQPGRGLWLDFNFNFNITHDIAIVVSVQGINPITGMVSNDRQLEQYRHNCPIHMKKFDDDAFCSDCGYHWPGHNYLATTCTPQGLLWLDGFRTVDGVVRQWIVTEDQARGIAAQRIGQDRVFAISATFFAANSSKKSQEGVLYQRAEWYPDVAAGAKINQLIYNDPNGLGYWRPDPLATIFINYCTPEAARQVFASGYRDKSKQGDGAFGGMRTGNP